ncbi:Myb-like_DNA-binding domain-containing protein [Hexamita inflata]|uniref:Myb-like DNA-binding domain-containing protein n=1 Tax=Hexamita inflata TaxID=28002 RepID=A0AA86P0G1_9EUKA|nr:Myb-like DNA-binding domain-containing protein [Hexamita inflata]
MYNKEYKNWTELERSQLVAVVEQSKRKCGQVNWDEVAKCMPSRSRQQCKSYFMNIMKKDCDMKMVKYHTWTEQEVGLLLWCAEAESKNWDTIQQNYFPGLTKHQLQAKHSYLVQQQLKAKAKTDGSGDMTQWTSSAQSGLERSEDLILISQLRDILNGVASK